MGKKNRNNDPSATLGGKFKNNIIYLTIADIARKHPDLIIDDTLTYHQRDPFAEFAIEDVQFQEYFKDTFEKEAHKRGLTINVKGVKPNADKDLRIITLQPWIKNGWIRFKRHGMGELIRQLTQFRLRGRGGHDDGPDALEMLKTLIETGLVKALAVSDKQADEGDDYHAPRTRRGRGINSHRPHTAGYREVRA